MIGPEVPRNPSYSLPPLPYPGNYPSTPSIYQLSASHPNHNPSESALPLPPPSSSAGKPVEAQAGTSSERTGRPPTPPTTPHSEQTTADPPVHETLPDTIIPVNPNLVADRQLRIAYTATMSTLASEGHAEPPTPLVGRGMSTQEERRQYAEQAASQAEAAQGAATVPLPEEPFTAGAVAAGQYAALEPGQTVSAPVPPALQSMAAHWAAQVREAYPGLTVDISHDTETGETVATITKGEGAPDQLPLYDARSVFRWQHTTDPLFDWSGRVPPSAMESAEPQDGPFHTQKRLTDKLTGKEQYQLAQARAAKQTAETRQNEVGVIKKEPKATSWGVTDSPLLGGDLTHSFDSWFKGTIPHQEGKPRPNIKQYIEETLASNTNRVAIELGGVGGVLFSGFTPGYFDRTLGISLTDSRKIKQSDDQITSADSAINHTFMPGDLNDPDIFQKIDTWLDGRPADLIMERMYGGISKLTQDPFAMGKWASFCYDRLAPNGLLFAQVPPVLEAYAKGWVHDMKTRAPHLDVSFDARDVYGIRAYQVIRIHKTPDGPAQLPLYDARFTLRAEALFRRYGRN